MIARLILRRIFADLGSSSGERAIRVEFFDKTVYENRPGAGKLDVDIKFLTPRAERRSLLHFYPGFFESYVDGEVEIGGEHPIAVLAEIGRKIALTSPGRIMGNPVIAVRKLLQEWRQSNSDRSRAIDNASFHYALHPTLFERMLGDTVGYSEGLWFEETRTLNQAKYNNYEYVCRKLRLRKGLRVLEVGAGWGYMAMHMARRYDVDVTIYNPVTRQNEYMLERFRRNGLGDRIRLFEGDLRDIARHAAEFDRFVSIGVHEHAGYSLGQYRLWAKAIASALAEGGLGLVSTTTFMTRDMTELLTLKYIFPGGHVPSLPHTLTAFQDAGLMMIEIENLWPHYQRTLSEWRERFAKEWPEIQKADPAVFTEAFRRAWTMWLEGTVESFSSALDLSHIVFAKGRAPEFFQRQPGEPLGFTPLGGDQEPEYFR